MQPEILTTPIDYTISGFSLHHDPAKPFGQEIISLLNRVWPVIKSNAIPNDGLNRVVYSSGRHGPSSGRASADAAPPCLLFAGVLLTDPNHPAAAPLEQKKVRLTRYAYWKHTGPYHLIPATGKAMTQALEAQGHKTTSPMIEVYGHWTDDPSKLETETLVALL